MISFNLAVLDKCNDFDKPNSGLELEVLKCEARPEIKHSAKPAFTGVVLERSRANEVNAMIETWTFSGRGQNLMPQQWQA
jgi:hypothetical protein